MKLFVSPHNDDETIFGAFTILRERPLVVVVFDSFIQPARGIPGTTAAERRAETAAACQILGVECQFIGYRDDQPPHADAIRGRLELFGVAEVWAPCTEMDGHEHHNLVARACLGLPGAKDFYLTYTKRGKSTNGRKVPYEPHWIGLKLRALAEYKSQFQPATGCAPHFIGRSLEEYYL